LDVNFRVESDNYTSAFVVNGADGATDVAGAFTAGSMTSDAGVSGVDLSASNDVLLADGAVVGITGNEVITFNAAGSINFTGATVDIDGALTAASVASDANVTGNCTSYASSAKLVYKKILNYDDDLTGNIILFDANAIIWSIKVNVITGWNSDTNDKLDIGVTASAAAYQNDLNIQATGWSITTAPTVGVKPGATYVTYTIVNQGEPVANQGVLEIYIEYSLY